MIIATFALALIIFLALSRRKFGLFILATSTGLVFNNYWNAEITDFITTASLNIPETTLSGIVGLVLIIVPGILILSKSSKEDNWIFGILGSVTSIVFLICIILPSFSQVFAFDAISQDIAGFIAEYADWIILIGIVSAILDVLAFNPKKLTKKS